MQIDRKHILLSYNNIEFIIQLCKELKFNTSVYIKPIAPNIIQIEYLEYIDKHYKDNNLNRENQKFINKFIKLLIIYVVNTR